MTQREITAATVEELIAKNISERFDNDHEVVKLSQHFRREGYVKLPGLVSPEVFDAVAEETHRLIDTHQKRIDIRLKETGDSPRYMSTVGQKAIATDGELVPAVYESPALKGFLSRIAKEEVLDCPWDEEKYIITRQHQRGDTHGWHWGDFSFTVIWLIEAPSLEYGGMLQCVPHTDWNKEDPRVEDYLQEHPIRSYGHAKGDMYFLRSDTTLHRTVPLNADRTRIILNTCWAGQRDMTKTATHETMQAMFD
ncbi:HalD/BesD family halogenase [Streptomyces jumonjinensis]|uniref:ArpA protein n=1 Tax=Streptomyces jumonjinensis TaxID=1945 RepID=A0A646K9T6_STRJU|nr:ArpA protein [Streptomyces jumonjinensis]MQS98913.1 ArpA protein [Streptomyces jumonjinensis]